MVFDISCTGSCHVGANPPAGLNLEAANSYMELVGIASSQDPGIMRVMAGDPDASYLIHRLDGTAPGFGVMPPGGALPQSSIDTIRAWILAGAVDDRPPPPPAVPVKVMSISPPPNAVLQAPPPQILAGFTRDLNMATVGPLSFILEASGASDGTFNDGNEIQISAAAINTPTSTSAVFDLTGVNMPDEIYQITLVGNGANAIMDLTPGALDGEYLGVLPSGDNTAGGDFQVTFSIVTPPMLGPTLPQIQTFVFGPLCASCHNGGGAVLPGVMNLSTEQASFDNLVNQASLQPGGGAALRVTPGQPNNSYLIQKLENMQMVGGVMPPTGMLPQPDIDQIRLWITNGAQRN